MDCNCNFSLGKMAASLFPAFAQVHAQAPAADDLAGGDESGSGADVDVDGSGEPTSVSLPPCPPAQARPSFAILSFSSVPPGFLSRITYSLAPILNSKTPTPSPGFPGAATAPGSHPAGSTGAVTAARLAPGGTRHAAGLALTRRHQRRAAPGCKSTACLRTTGPAATRTCTRSSRAWAAATSTAPTWSAAPSTPTSRTALLVAASAGT